MLLTCLTLACLSLPTLQDGPSNEWSKLTTLLLNTASKTPTSPEEALDRRRQVAAIVQTLRVSSAARTGEQQLLYIQACESLCLYDLIIDETECLSAALAAAPLWRARTRALVSTGATSRAAQELSLARTNPKLNAALDGIDGLLAHGFDRCGDTRNASLHGRRHIASLLRESNQALLATAALTTQALLTRDRIVASATSAAADQFLAQVLQSLNARLAEKSSSDATLEGLCLRHLRMSARANISEVHSLDISPRIAWLDWLLEGSLRFDDTFWPTAFQFALRDTAQCLNTLLDAEPIRIWCEAASRSPLRAQHPQLIPTLQTLVARSINRSQHLAHIAASNSSGAPRLVLLLRDPEHPTEESRSALQAITTAHPELRPHCRSPRASDPAVEFLPQWLVHDADGRLSQVLVGEGHHTRRALLKALASPTTKGLTLADPP